MGTLKLLTILCATLILNGSESILQGVPITDNSYPYNAFIRIIFNEDFSVDQCGATIINSQWILTLASCVTISKKFEVRLGSTKKSTSVNAPVELYIVHPNFLMDSFPVNNIALVKLKTPLVFTTNIKAIALDCNKIGNGVRGHVSGWGWTELGGVFPDDLHYDNVTVEDQSTCKTDWYVAPINEGHFCTVYNTERGISYGDVGDPLESNGKLIGIAAFAEPSGGYPDIYYRISYYCRWIIDTIG